MSAPAQAQAARSAPPATLLGQTAVLTGRTVRRMLRSTPVIISTLAFPVLLMFVQAALLQRLVADLNGRYVDRLAPLIMLISVLFGVLPTAIGFFGDLRGGLLTRLRSLPISPWALIGSRVLADLSRIMVTTGMTALAAYPLGFRFTQGPLAALVFFLVVAAFGVVVTCVGLLVALVSKSEAGIQSALGGPGLLLAIVSSGFVPLEAFPGVLQPVVAANPVSMAVDALAALSSAGGDWGPGVGQVLTVCVAVAVPAAVLAMRKYSGEVRRS